MKVKELIEKLNTMDQDTELFIFDDGDYINNFNFEKQRLATYYDGAGEGDKVFYATEQRVEDLAKLHQYIQIIEKITVYVWNLEERWR